MASNDYHSIKRWIMPGTTVEEIYDLLSEANRLPTWCRKEADNG